ncbi:MAG: hypothetical protein OQK46_02950 [Gammaproteobacteria bacterium]|nr:hypothetical protein [Gammaproteobacteria bacterium]
MNSVDNYKWHGHNINIQAQTSPKFLWLNYRLSVEIDNTQAVYQYQHALTRSFTNFHLNHNGRNLKGQIISAGLPLTPVISLLTIVDDTIIGRSRILLGSRIFIYLLLSATALGLNL